MCLLNIGVVLYRDRFIDFQTTLFRISMLTGWVLLAAIMVTDPSSVENGIVMFNMFILDSEYSTAGDQQQAIDMLVKQIDSGKERCILVGVTGSGKTFVMANIIKRLQITTLILSHNKTLARQLWQEMLQIYFLKMQLSIL